ncbi:Calponin-3 [Holothuria leucospilota]|uniref:Transgelin n=1 Tax=Holothuria leucospilota TaxID=206669 RepID=A0A9Q1HD06_HOLLE|nr:Calponin-3 [Holothuria leucospilota]
MSNRAAKSGLSAEAQRKVKAKYDENLEAKIRTWFQEILGEPLEPREIGVENFQVALKDGTKLCELINKIQPGSVKKINRGKMMFTQLENITNFNEAIKAYGVPVSSTFQSVDLYEAQDMASVQNAIWSLASLYIKKGGLSSLGVKIADENKRDFDEETLRQGQAVIGLQMGTNKGATQSGMTAMGTQRKL